MNYRSLFCISSAMLCLSTYSSAEIVTPKDAARVAQCFMTAQGITSAPNLTPAKAAAIRSGASADAGESPAYHIFYSADSSSLVVVAGDDVARPILGYTKGFMANGKAAELPPAMLDWLADIERQILAARASNKEQSAEVSQMWAATEPGNPVVQLQTAQWNQRGPYNGQCPLIGQDRTLTGCVATSFGIMMKYYGYPDKGRYTIPAYTTDDNLYVPARDISDHVYAWDNILMEYKSGQYTQTQADAVAQLLADVGAAIQADYGLGETSAYQGLSTLFKHFDFNPGTRIVKENFSADEWAAILRAELDKQRPVWYSGAHSTGGGHAFLLDGYTDNGFFSVNWGWGGSCNGYFALDAMEPDADTEYNSDQDAYIDVVPANMLPALVEMGDGVKCPSLNAAIGLLSDDGQATSAKLLQDFTTGYQAIDEGKNLSLDLNGHTMNITGGYGISNNGTLTISDGVGGGKILTDINNSIISNSGTLNIESGTLANTCSSIDETDYRRCIYIREGSTVNIKGGEFSSANQVLCVLGDLNVSGGTFTSRDKAYIMDIFGGKTVIEGGSFDYTFYFGDGSEVVIKDGSFTSPTQLFWGYGKCEISGGTFVTTGNNAIMSYYYATPLAISGGTFINSCDTNEGTDYRRCLYATGEAKVNISGGTFTSPNQTIVILGEGEISGGTITNTSTNGIGLASNGTVTVTDVRIKASRPLYAWSGATLTCSGGLFSTTIANNFLATSCQCVANDDAETKSIYPYRVLNPATGLGFVANAPAVNGLRYDLNGVLAPNGNGLGIVRKNNGQSVKVLTK